jgi:membrane protein implicated in regulation of membrane protease activity
MWKHRRTTLTTIGSVFLAVAPKCPICFFAYFGIFGVATASASVYRVWLPPLTAIWLALTVGMLFFQRGGQRRYGPGLLGIFAGLAVFAGRFLVDYQALVYAGIAALVVAVVWRTWSRRSASAESCSQCDEIPLMHDSESRVSGT